MLQVFGSTEGAQTFSFSTEAAFGSKISAMSIEEPRLSVRNELVACVCIIIIEVLSRFFEIFHYHKVC